MKEKLKILVVDDDRRMVKTIWSPPTGTR